jgi:hypothetical protein
MQTCSWLNTTPPAAFYGPSGPGKYDDKGNAVAHDATGYLYLAGDFGSPFIIFGADTLENSGNTDIFLAKLDDNVTGTSETPGLHGLAIFPNPATGNITISFPADETGGHITVYNLQGQLLLQQAVNGKNNTVDVMILPTGL